MWYLSGGCVCNIQVLEDRNGQVTCWSKDIINSAQRQQIIIKTLVSQWWHIQTISVLLLSPGLKRWLLSRGKLFGGTVPPNNTLFGGTDPPNSTLFGGTPDSEKWYVIQRKVLDFF